MAHAEQQAFFINVKNKFPEKFKNCTVLDVGSLDINGNNHYLFENYIYTGIDIGEGNNVDVVCKGHEYKPNQQFDIVISSECFEHDMFYKETIKNCIELTKKGGMFTFTCASEGRPEHGTLSSLPDNAPPLEKYYDWANYYKNLNESDIREIINPDNIFSEYYFEYNPNSHDLYFWGIKK